MQTPLIATFGARKYCGRDAKVVAMTRSKIADAMLTWLRAEEPRSSTTEGVLVWVGYVVFGIFVVFFFAMAVVMLIGVVTPGSIDAPNRWLALANLVVATGGLAYSVWRLRKHVRLHGHRSPMHKQRAEVKKIMELERRDGES